MIKILHGEKYFNKNKTNSIHVINDTSFVLPDRGMVMILGPSGSGKTTLLYSLGGLESLDSGTIYYDNIPANKKNWDNIRAERIGYVFQNYFLLPELNVEDNLRVVLDMFEMSEEEKNQRINDSLEAVGLAHFSHRYPHQLSGGQQQRIAIARALCKNPNMIIADEPTGNLDEANTIQIMNIFKKISLTRLVLIVTHEERVAKFYADRLIVLSDGIIQSDTKNEHTEGYELKEDAHIYLGEYQQESYSTSLGTIEVYAKDNSQPLTHLKIIERNGTYMLYAEEPLKIIEKDMICYGHKKIEQTSDEAASSAWNPNYEKRALKRHAVSWSKSFKEAFGSIFKSSGKRKGLLIAYMLTMIITIIGLTLGLMSIDFSEINYLTGTKEAVLIKDYSEVNYNTREELIDSDLDINLMNMTLSYIKLNRFMNASATIPLSSGELVVKSLDDSQIIYGQNFKANFEVVADAAWLKAIMSLYNTASYGYNYLEDFIGVTCTSLDNTAFTIVGICDRGEQALYLSAESYSYACTLVMKNYLHPYGDSEHTLNYVTLDQQINQYTSLDGQTINLNYQPLKDYEVIVPNNTYYKNNIENNSEFSKTYHPFTSDVVSQHTFTIVGTYEIDTDTNLITAYVTEKTKRSVYSDYGYLTGFLMAHTDNISLTQEELNNMGIHNADITAYLKKTYIQNVIDSHMGNIISIMMALVGGLFFIYFMMRSSLQNRIKDIGIKRALGFKKSDIERTFVSEIIVINVISIIFCLIVYWLLIGSLKDVLSILNCHIELWMPMSGIVLCFGSSLLIGMLPVWSFTHQSPAHVINHYDL